MLTPLIVALALVAGAEPIPAKALFGKPAVGDVALSPSGRWLAVTLPGEGGRMELKVTDLDSPPLKFKGIAWLRDLDIAGITWVNDRRLLFSAYDSQAGAFGGTRGLWAIDADGENGRLLIDAKYRWGEEDQKALERAVGKLESLGGQWRLAGLLPGDGDEVLVREWRRSTLKGAGAAQLARLDTRARFPKPVRITAGAPDGAQRWITDPGGNPRYVEAWQAGKDVTFRRTEAGEWEAIASFADLGDEGWRARAFADGKLFVSVEPPGATGEVLTTLDATTKKPAASPVLAEPGFDVGSSASPVVDEETGKLLGWRYLADGLRTRWLDERLKGVQAGIDAALPGRTNVLSCRRCGTAKRWLVTSSSDRTPPTYFLFDTAVGRLSQLGSALPDVGPGQVGERTFERFKARDGREIPVHVTRPPQDEGAPAPGPLPAVVWVHGGPASRVTGGWQEFAVPQFLSSRGYVVLEPEFRGSAGYGLAHEKAGRRQWGLAMQDDLDDAVRWAVEKKLVAPGRVCIMGFSYGGYAALLGPAHAPGLYRCAISGVGVTDLPQLFKEEEDSWSSDDYGALGLRYLALQLGDPEQDADRLKQTSPVHRAKALKGVPLLAAWGKEDKRVPLVHGRRFRDAAEAAGVELEYVEYADEGHSWLLTATWLDFMRRTEKLLARTIGPDAAKTQGP